MSARVQPQTGPSPPPSPRKRGEGVVTRLSAADDGVDLGVFGKPAELFF